MATLIRFSRPERPYREEASAPPGRLKIALQRRPLSGAAVASECESALQDAGRLMESLGHTVEEAQPSGDWDEAISSFTLSQTSLVDRRFRVRSTDD